MVCKSFKELLIEECIFILMTGFMEMLFKKSAFFWSKKATHLDVSPESPKIVWRKHSFEFLFFLHLH